ncbi:M24 family metallopeptidase [Williamsia deligens]|uniref:M24 family metallopeptidase n=1 Tax=Williamsia deligens TaxID=321325 RepID=A0ABW3G3V9_9NOCA|nr:M24 family metallopeptidase [Williamsia deligens]
MAVETDEEVRAQQLIAAEARAVELFDAVVARGILRPGVSERAASDTVRDLAADMFDVDRFWHKRIVRAGPNTLHPYSENPPDRDIAEDDIVFLDLGPVLEQWEADLGRTYVVGDDARKHALAASVQTVWDGARDHFAATEDITGEQLYDHVCRLAADAGWEFGGSIAGHLVGQFPHKHISGSEVGSYIAPGSREPMRRRDRAGLTCHWILEVHLVDRDVGIGGFFEQLLDIGPNAR